MSAAPAQPRRVPASAAPRRVRADAERSTARILDAAERLLPEDPNASLERIADEAGVARATVHRRFSSRQALIEALVARLNDCYLGVVRDSRIDTAPPLVALHQATEKIFELKVSFRLALDLLVHLHAGTGGESHLTAEVIESIDQLFARLHAGGIITEPSPAWCRKVYLAVLDEVHQLPDDAPELAGVPGSVAARTALQLRTVLGALGGPPRPRPRPPPPPPPAPPPPTPPAPTT
jgi:AcrR family transcriptional regulator